ncbi:hypothetical protein [Arthrobacter pityocampae]|uniref:hypothetical protein n=1 Tax=Arthrobacter pityocampae TaxID=547334 RepID=UPI00373548B9
MQPQLFHLEGPSLEELKAKAAALYGPRALIVSAELVTVGGIRGVLSRKHYEIVVEVPEPDGVFPAGSGVPHRGRTWDGSRERARGGPDAPGGGGPRGRRSAAAGPAGLDALLQQAELDEVRIAAGHDDDRTGTPASPDTPPAVISTDSGLFAALMDELTFATDPAAAPAPSPAPSPSVAPSPAADASAVAGAVTARPRRAFAVGRDAVAPSGTSDVPVTGTRTRRSVALGRDVEALPAPRVPEYPATDAGTATEPGPPSGSDATFLHEGAGAPTDLPEVRGTILRISDPVASVPSVLRAPGDLVVVVGVPAVGWSVASSMATVLGRGAPTAVAVSGPPNRALPEARSIDDGLEANAARAAGVDGGHAVFVALSSEDPLTDVRALFALRPDQVWLAVDAGRKEADTAAWVGALCRSMERARLAPAGLAVIGSTTTATPETVQALGLPVGWLEGRPAAATAAASSPASVGSRRTSGGRRRAEPTGIE